MINKTKIQVDYTTKTKNGNVNKGAVEIYPKFLKLL